ncbi:MAG: phage tail protein [Anaerolineaceae bacterium]|nr:phage tail protein [Anaerolineaceae bacterium]
MAIERENPYSAFNFLVDLGTGDTASVKAGFQEVSGLNYEVTMADYRNGNEKTNRVRKVSTMFKVGDVTLKRGLIGATDLLEWMEEVRNGDQNAARNVTIQLLDEARQGPVMTWQLINARPMRYTVPSFNAKSASDVAIEELVFVCDDMTVE